jgi:hypothetical protein
MRTAYCLAALLALSLCGNAGAVDLTRIDRSIRKEPVYQSNAPQYALLVFGAHAKVRVWVVLDGDVLYLDRNGNGDLTDPGERITAEYALRRPEIRPGVEIMRNFDLVQFKRGEKEKDDRPILSCWPEVTWLHVFNLVLREDIDAPGESPIWRKTPFEVAIYSTTGHNQRADVAFASRPQDAPILHFDGPLHLAIHDVEGPFAFRSGEPTEMYIRLVTPGLKARISTDHGDLTETAHPVAEIEFPPGRPSGEPIRRRVELTNRC